MKIRIAHYRIPQELPQGSVKKAIRSLVEQAAEIDPEKISSVEELGLISVKDMRDKKIPVRHYGGLTVAYVNEDDKKIGRMAVCGTKERFNRKLGRALAEERLNLVLA